MSIDISAFVFTTVEDSERINQLLRDQYPELLTKDFIISRVTNLQGMQYDIACESLGIDPSVKGDFIISLNNKSKLIESIVPIFKEAYGNKIKLLLNREDEL